MRLDSTQLKQHLTQTVAPLYVLVGDEPLAQSECLDAIRQAARKAGADERTGFIVERYFNWQSITQYAQALSLFSSLRILEISIPSGKPGVDGGKALTELAANMIPDTTTIIILPSLEREAKNSAGFGNLHFAAVLGAQATDHPRRRSAGIDLRGSHLPLKCISHSFVKDDARTIGVNDNLLFSIAQFCTHMQLSTAN